MPPAATAPPISAPTTTLRTLPCLPSTASSATVPSLATTASSSSSPEPLSAAVSHWSSRQQARNGTPLLSRRGDRSGGDVLHAPPRLTSPPSASCAVQSSLLSLLLRVPPCPSVPLRVPPCPLW